MKKLEDYIHLYIGCQVFMPNGAVSWGTRYGNLTGIHGEHGPQVQLTFKTYADEHPTYPGIEEIKLILRPLESMTGEEIKQWVAQPDLTDHYCAKKLREISVSVYGLYNFISFYGSHDSIKWLLNKGFDIFGLIPAGLAQKREG